MAQLNQNGYFLIDTNLATKGFQGQSAVKGIGPTAQVGFALYSQAWDSSIGWTVHFEWDGSKADFRKSSGGQDIVDNTITLNGASFTPPVETNIIGSSTISGGEILPVAGANPAIYEISVAQQGGTAVTTPVGLIYFAVFRTVATFKTTDLFTVAATVAVLDKNSVKKDLGTRYFYVNREIGVKDSSWGEVKAQFKDF